MTRIYSANTPEAINYFNNPFSYQSYSNFNGTPSYSNAGYSTGSPYQQTAWFTPVPSLFTNPLFSQEVPQSTQTTWTVASLEAAFQKRAPGARDATVTVSVDPAKAPTIQKFIDVILDANKYPRTGTYGVSIASVQVLSECRKIGQVGGYHLVYQKVAGNRHYVIAMTVSHRDDDTVIIKWNGVQESKLTPKEKSELAKNPEPDPVYPPWIEGHWLYSHKDRTITYHVSSVPGGYVPSGVTPTGAALVFPKELIKTHGWGAPQ